ncbi:hypothetical protein H7K38_21270 [Mycobacterium alsense]|uniref:Uncharacterized protein n=1 Tax=Mycobacterium alsense TaxID=324058 RepID=A0AA42C0S3_9MYCO|nr:hypothetical protein [Mycobacterium alsense]MCV7381162.1 hypothetical protein [Mycobacterium alsense]
MILDRDDPEIAELAVWYNRWRQIYGYAEQPPPDEVHWDRGRLYFRFGYPSPDWWGYILEATAEGCYRVLRTSTERRAVPVESSLGIFSRIEDAGKFIIYSIAESLRIDSRMDPVGWKWDNAGLDPQVDADVQSDRVVRYVLRTNPNAYFVMTRADMRCSHLLPLSYSELDAVLLDGFPESVTSRINTESR